MKPVNGTTKQSTIQKGCRTSREPATVLTLLPGWCCAMTEQELTIAHLSELTGGGKSTISRYVKVLRPLALQLIDDTRTGM